MMPSPRVVLVTGGSSGIGKQLAADLLKRGDRVAIISHDAQRLANAEAELRTISPHVRAICCDVRSTEDVCYAITQTLATFQRIDVLVNNAGYAVYRTFDESSLDEVLDIVDVNLLGTLRFIKACIPVMKAQKSGWIVNVSSIAGKMVITPNSSYCASKHGVVGISEALRFELEPLGIGISVVCPGRTETAFFDHETFRTRTARPETQLTVPIERVSSAIIEAIDRGRYLSYVPRYLGLVAWAYQAFPWIIQPVYGMILRDRIRTLLSGVQRSN